MRAINQVAKEIKQDWKNISIYAKPYLDAMLTLSKKEDMYYAESAKGIVIYFLANANGYRGETAKKLKAELKEIIK